MAGVDWSPAEDEILRRHYRTAGGAATAAMLPRRSRATVQKRASILGCVIRPNWSQADDTQLMNLWESGRALPSIAQRLGRSPTAVYKRAVRIGLHVGAPRGCEYLYASVQRTGFNSTAQLRRVLQWAGVEIYPALSDPKERKGRRRRQWHQHYVEPVAVDEAVARWVRSETVTDAAHRYGIADMTMRKWLLRAGVIESRTNGGRAPHRIEKEEIDRVMACRSRRLAELAVFGRKPREGEYERGTYRDRDIDRAARREGGGGDAASSQAGSGTPVRL